MITLTNVKAELEKLSMLRDRTPSSSSAPKEEGDRTVGVLPRWQYLCIQIR
jgi:hypothetical protein